MRHRVIGRREACGIILGAAGALVRPPNRLDAALEHAHAGRADVQPGLLIRNARPLDAESPIEALRTFETNNDLFFVRSHHAVLPTDASTPWTLTIDGEVAHTVTVSLDDIRRMPAQHRSVTIECAGNGRGRLDLPATSGVQWGFGAVSTATWTGVPLAALLERAGIQASAAHFWMEAADRSPLPTAPPFLRSIPREIALGEALVAYEMNGQRLPLLHGGPLRLVVPRWYGMASTKWLTHVHARAKESDNHFMARGYRYADGSPVDLMRVKSLITSPLEGARVPVGTTRVTGVAWTGTGTVSKVEISYDEGRTWQQARFTTEAQPGGAEAPPPRTPGTAEAPRPRTPGTAEAPPPRTGAWRLWEADVTIQSAGEHRLRARASDTAGHTQPEHAAPNPGGYGNNSIHEVRFDVR